MELVGWLFVWLELVILLSIGVSKEFNFKCLGYLQDELYYFLWGRGKRDFLVQHVRVFRGVFRPRQTRQLPRAVDLKGRLLSCQSY